MIEPYRQKSCRLRRTTAKTPCITKPFNQTPGHNRHGKPSKHEVYQNRTHIKTSVSVTKDIVLVDVAPLSLGIELSIGEMKVIVPRNTTTPTRKVGRVTTSFDNHTEVSFPVSEGERLRALENNFLGKFFLSGIPPAPQGVPQMDVWFDLNADGILTVSAEDVDTGNKNQITITNQSRLPKEEVERLSKEAEKCRNEDEQYLRKVMAKNALENYANRMLVALTDSKPKISRKDKNKIYNAIKKSIEWLDWNFQLSEVSKFEEKLQDFCEHVLADATRAKSSKPAAKTRYSKCIRVLSKTVKM